MIALKKNFFSRLFLLYTTIVPTFTNIYSLTFSLQPRIDADLNLLLILFYGFIMAFEKFNTEEFENYVLLTQTAQCLFSQKCQTIIIVTVPVHSLFVVL